MRLVKKNGIICLLAFLLSCDNQKASNSQSELQALELDCNIKDHVSDDLLLDYTKVKENINKCVIDLNGIEQASKALSKTVFNDYQKVNYIIEAMTDNGNQMKLFYNEKIYVRNPWEGKKRYFVLTGELKTTEGLKSVVVSFYNRKGLKESSFTLKCSDYLLSEDSIVINNNGLEERYSLNENSLFSDKKFEVLRENTIAHIKSEMQLEFKKVDTLRSIYYDDFEYVEVDLAMDKNVETNYILDVANPKSLSEGLVIGYSETKGWDYDMYNTIFKLNYFSALENKWYTIDEFESNYFEIDKNHLIKTKHGCCGIPSYIEVFNIAENKVVFSSNLDYFSKIKLDSIDGLSSGYIGITDFENNLYIVKDNSNKIVEDSIYISNNKEILFRSAFNAKTDEFLIINGNDTINFIENRRKLKDINLKRVFNIYISNKEGIELTKEIILSNN